MGHTSGDRECEMRDQNPNEEFHRMVEDPMQAIMAMRQQEEARDKSVQGSLQLKAHISRDINILPRRLVSSPSRSCRFFS